MATRRINGTIYHPFSNNPWVGGVVRFILDRVFATASAVYPTEEFTTALDSSGAFSVLVAVPDDNALVATYRCVLPDNTSFGFQIGDNGADAELEILIGSSSLSASSISVQVLVDAHAAIIAGTTRLGHIKVGSGLNIDSVGVLSVPGGGSDKTYRHVQSVASSNWTVTHNLGKRASVIVVDTAGDAVQGSIHYVSDDQVTLAFSAAFAGEAYIN